MTDPGETVDTRLVVGPNASLTDRQAVAFFAGMCVVCFTIAGAFASLGFWPVLPFAGLELAALGAALVVVVRHNRYREVIELTRTRVRVEFGMVGEGARARCEWPRSATRVWLEPGPRGAGPSRLVLACGPSRLVLATCLCDAERASLAARLKELLYPAWQQAGAMPTLGPAA